MFSVWVSLPSMLSPETGGSPENCFTSGSASAWKCAVSSGVHQWRIAARVASYSAQHVDEVTDVVADDGADGAVVRGVRCRRIELGRLQQRGREVVRVLLEHEDGADRLRRDPPLAHVHRLAEPGHGVAVVAVRDAPEIAHGVARIHDQSRNSPATARGSRCRRTASSAWPAPLPSWRATSTSPPRPACGTPRDIGDDALHPGLLLGREIALGVHPPEGVAHGRLRGVERALGARPVLRLTGRRAMQRRACSATTRGSTSA